MNRDEDTNPVSGNPSIQRYVLKNKFGTRITILNLGGIISAFEIPLPDGTVHDIVLGFDNPERYLDEHPYFGSIVGRYANRIGGATFDVDGKTYRLAKNNGENHIHGGTRGLDKVIWNARTFNTEKGPEIMLSHTSPDGDEGYPGNLAIEVSFLLTEQNELVIEYHAKTDKPTFVNLTHHDYFNLGDLNEPVYNHQVRIYADHYLEVDEGLIPTGMMIPVDHTPMDFSNFKAIGQDIHNVEPGYDHCFVLGNEKINDPKLSVQVRNPQNGLILEMLTTEPGVQFYTGNFLDGSITGKNNIAYQKHAAFCLEAQHFPDSPHHPGFPETLIRPGEVYFQKTIYRISHSDHE